MNNYAARSRGICEQQRGNRNFALRVVILGLLQCFFLALPQWAQQTAPPAVSGWGGVVRNASGQPIAGGTVKLSGQEDVRTTMTGPDGSFSFLNLAPGQYALTVSSPDKEATAALSIEIPGPAVVLTVTQQNAIAITATPIAQATAAKATSGGEKLSSQAVSELPLNGRDFSTLLLLAAGTMTDVNGATNFTEQFAINGQRGVEAVFAMDGADVSDPEMGSGIQQFQRRCHSGDPIQLRMDAGGDRKGRSRIHRHHHTLRQKRLPRIVFRVVRNSAFDARNYFDYPSIAEPGRFRPSIAMSLDSRMAAQSSCLICMTDAGRPFTSASTRASGRFSGLRRFSPCPLWLNAPGPTR